LAILSQIDEMALHTQGTRWIASATKRSASLGIALFFIGNFLKVAVNFEKYDKQFAPNSCANTARHDNK